MEATNSDPSLEADSDRSCESDNTEQFSCDVDDQYVPKVGMLFGSLEEARKFYADYARCVGFSTKIRNTNRSKKSNQILNQLLSCNREGKRRSDVPISERTNAIYAANCPSRMYVHHLNMIDSWEISKVRRTIEINDQAGIPPSKSYQSLVMATGEYEKLNFIEKDMWNFITREVRNVSEEDDARELGNLFS
ncbi:hypothetical protein PIB30_032999 [Stylosanthes scabra]|uniref:FAR1 domain-containing protein n=1 Tax=Stylosanthes scabra TaxID=79078 RepID=A0ABU6TC44_9FABA|nr:hypothetical protein [Stylosanthes scabra]